MAVYSTAKAGFTCPSNTRLTINRIPNDNHQARNQSYHADPLLTYRSIEKMDEEMQPIEHQPANLDQIDAISDQLILLANKLLESKLARASSSSYTTRMEQEEADQESILEELECDQDLIVLAAPLFARLKAINRSSSSMLSTFKSQSHKLRNHVDQIHLDLQNLIYERRHLEKEIKKCQEFESSPLLSSDSNFRSFKTHAPLFNICFKLGYNYSL